MIDLHLHLDGSLTSEDVKYLAFIQGIKLPSGFEKNICVSSYCLSLNDYLKCFEIPLSVLQTKEALECCTKRILDRLLSQGLIYAEIRFAPQLHTSKGLSQEDTIKAVLKGQQESKPKSKIILCCMRNTRNGESNLETVRLAKKYLNKGVAAIDLAGAEGLYPTMMFEPLFNYARSLNVPFTIHAGEADGPLSVEKALDFGAKRIGHGVRAFLSQTTMERLIKEQIPLEICLTSEIQTKAVKDSASHPIKELIKSGANITINTDDMAISNITLNSEFSLLKRKYKVTEDETKKLISNSIEAAFLSENEKEELRIKLKDNFAFWYQNIDKNCISDY